MTNYLTTLNKPQVTNYKFVLLFRQFMLINNRYSFSSIEIKDIGIQLNKILSNPKNFSCQYIVSLLTAYGIKNVWSKNSHSYRSRLWFYKDLDGATLKVRVNV